MVFFVHIEAVNIQCLRLDRSRYLKVEFWSKGSVQVEVLIIVITCHKIAACCVSVLVKVNVMDVFVSDLRE